MRRRDVLKLGLTAGAGSILPGNAGVVNAAKGDPDLGSEFDLPSPPTTPFIDPVPVPPFAQQVAAFLPDTDTYPASLYPDHAGFPSLHCKEQIADEATGEILPNVKFFELVEEEVEVQLHSELAAPTKVWRYRDADYDDTGSPPSGRFAGGPTFKVFVNEAPANTTPSGDPLGGPVILRVRNELPADHVGFGVPDTTTHLHGGHQDARSDGFPESGDGVPFHPVIHPGEFYDYCYALRDPGFSHGEPITGDRSSTIWFHDHLLDFTGPNVYRGLAGFFLVFDEADADDETGVRFPETNLRLPSGDFDVPLVLQDRRVDSDSQLVYLPEDHDGFIGDKFMVNGAFQPFLEVQRRKYRFRILNGANARFFLLTLEDASGNRQDVHQIGVDATLFSRRLTTNRLLMSNAQRKQIVIDFSQYDEGDKLYLIDHLDQDDGRGPDGDLDDGIDELLERSEGHVRLVEFRVVGGEVDDPSRVPEVIRPRDPISPELLAEARMNRREIKFDRRRGAWAINGEFIDIDKPFFEPRLNRPEIWTLKTSGGWWHPIHVHLDGMLVLSRNGGPPLEDEDSEITQIETLTLGPGDEVEVLMHFRDYPGSFVFHCHNIEHEDMFMMARIDIRPEHD